MNEFEEKDYGQARSYADFIFNDIDNTMNSLYGSNWESCGADDARARYNEIRKNYEVFYDKVSLMKTHIYNVTAANEEADASASQTISSI